MLESTLNERLTNVEGRLTDIRTDVEARLKEIRTNIQACRNETYLIIKIFLWGIVAVCGMVVGGVSCIISSEGPADTVIGLIQIIVFGYT